MILLSTKKVTHGYQRLSFFKRQPNRHVLKDIDLEIHTGESVAILGRSGCGKSTLVRLLTGLEIPQSGDVLFQGHTTRQMSRHQLNTMHQHVQMVFQDPISAVDPRQTIQKIISEPLRYLSNMTPNEQRNRVNELLELIGLNHQYLKKYPSQVSGGQLQRVCIARALASHPKLIILDESLSNLDLVLQIQMMKQLKTVQQQTNITWLLVTHDLRIARQFCQRVFVMDEGRIVETCHLDNPSQFQHPASLQLQRAILPALPESLMKGERQCKESPSRWMINS